MLFFVVASPLRESFRDFFCPFQACSKCYPSHAEQSNQRNSEQQWYHGIVNIAAESCTNSVAAVTNKRGGGHYGFFFDNDRVPMGNPRMNEPYLDATPNEQQTN